MLSTAYLKQNLLSKLTTKSLRLLTLIESFTDLDGRILTSIDELKEKGIVSPRLVPAALEEMEKFNFLSKDTDGNYINKYHYLSTKNETQYTYVNLYDFFENEKFTGLYKRDLLFFYYILTSKKAGTYHTVAAELLYNNQINKQDIKFTGFQDFNDLATRLSHLVSLGFIEVRLDKTLYSNPSGENQQEYAERVKNALYKYCSKDSNKKSRIRNKRDRHLLKIRVTESLVSTGKKSKYDTRSTLRDLQAAALDYGFDLNDYHIEYLKPVHMLKEKLHREFGKAGIAMYRKSILEYFENQAHSFDQHIISGQFHDIVKKFYVMPKITLQLHAFMDNIDPKIDNISQDFRAITSRYVHYLTKESYMDDMVIFYDEVTKKHDLLYAELVDSSQNWESFNKLIKGIFHIEKQERNNNRNDVVSIAMDRKLSDRDRIKSDRQQAEESSKTQSSKPVQFYNWLEN